MSGTVRRRDQESLEKRSNKHLPSPPLLSRFGCILVLLPGRTLLQNSMGISILTSTTSLLTSKYCLTNSMYYGSKQVNFAWIRANPSMWLQLMWLECYCLFVEPLFLRKLAEKSSVFLPVYSSVSLFICLSLFVWLSVCICLSLSVYLSLSLLLFLSLSFPSFPIYSSFTSSLPYKVFSTTLSSPYNMINLCIYFQTLCHEQRYQYWQTRPISTGHVFKTWDGRGHWCLIRHFKVRWNLDHGGASPCLPLGFLW